MLLLAICISSLGKCLFKPFAHFLIRSLFKNFYLFVFKLLTSYQIFQLLSSRTFLYILDINPLSDIWFVNIFSHSVGCLFTLLTVSLCFWSMLYNQGSGASEVSMQSRSHWIPGSSLLIVSFDAHNLKIFMKFSLFTFYLFPVPLVLYQGIVKSNMKLLPFVFF